MNDTPPTVLLPDPESDGASPVVAPNPRGAAPASIGRFSILGEIARGGVGVVLRGHDPELGRDVAVKVLRDEFTERPDVLRRFVEEAQIGGQLQHPGIVPVYELGVRDDGRPFFAMKLVKGRTLAAALAERRSPAEDRVRFVSIVEAVCQTVAYAHARGVIHRDLKPGNVMIGAFGEVQVVDWGLAKVLARGGVAGERPARPDAPRGSAAVATVETAHGSQPSVVGTMLGTPQYMAPEQARGDVERLDERSDVFSLGAILCEVLTGAPPYRGSPGEIPVLALRADVADALERLDSCGADADLVALAKRALAPAPDERPRNAGEMARELARHLSGVEERARSAQVAAAEARVREAEQRATAEAEKATARQARIDADDLRRQADEARRAARRVLLVVAWLVVILGGGAWTWSLVASARSERVRAADRRVEAAMEEMALLRRHGLREQDLDDWDGASLAAASAARAAADPDVTPERRTEALRLAADVEADVARVKAALEHHRRGTELSRDDDVDGAIAAFRRAIDLLPNHAAFHVDLGNACYRRRQLPDAIAAYRAAARITPNSSEPRLRLVIALLAADEPRQALESGRELIRLEPDSAEAHLELGHALRALGEFESAGHEFREALRYLPDWGAAAFDLRALAAEREIDAQMRSALAAPSGTPPDAWARFAESAHRHRLYPTAARCRDELLRRDADRTSDAAGESLYEAARSASLAGAGCGIEASKLDDAARATWRRQAAAWLRELLAACRSRADAGATPARLVELVRRSRSDPALAPLRDADRLKDLPAEERAALTELWNDVGAALERSAR